MRVFILARTEQEITQEIYPVLADTGARIVGYATSTEELAKQLEISRPDCILVKMTLSRRGEEEEFLANLGPYRLIIVLPHDRGSLRESLRGRPNVAAVGVEPVDYVTLLKAVNNEAPPPGSDGKPSATPSASVGDGASRSPLLASEAQPTPTALAKRPKRARIITFTSGTIGGTGKSTLAGALAWMLAHEGQVDTILLSLGTPAAAITHLKIARWPDIALFLEGEECFERTLQRQNALTVGITPGDPITYERIGALMPHQPGAVLRAIEEAAARFELVIVDLPPDSTGWGIHPLLDADDVVIVARPTVADQAGVVQTMTLLQALHHGRATQTHLVLNDRSGQDIRPEAFLTGAAQIRTCPSLIGIIPHNRGVRLAQNEGVPLPLAEGCDDVVVELRRLAHHMGFELRGAKTGKTITVNEPGTSRPVLARRRTPYLPALRIKLMD